MKYAIKVAIKGAIKCAMRDVTGDDRRSVCLGVCVKAFFGVTIKILFASVRACSVRGRSVNGGADL